MTLHIASLTSVVCCEARCHDIETWLEIQPLILRTETRYLSQRRT